MSVIRSVKPRYIKVLSMVDTVSSHTKTKSVAEKTGYSYHWTWETLRMLEKAGLVVRVGRGYGYVKTGEITIQELFRHPYLMRSKHAPYLLRLLNLREVGVREAARLLGTSAGMVHKLLKDFSEDGLVVKSPRGYILRERVVGLDTIADIERRAVAVDLVKRIPQGVIAVIHYDGQFLVTLDIDAFFSGDEIVAIAAAMKNIGAKGIIIMPHHDWLLYLVFTHSPSLSHYLFGDPIYGSPWFDERVLTEQHLKFSGISSIEVNKGLARGYFKKSSDGALLVTKQWFRKVFSALTGEVEFTPVNEYVQLAKLV